MVASEVRALAQRSADAAKEIKALISNSNREVGAGVGPGAADGRGPWPASWTRCSRSNGLVSGISTAANEQAAALQGVNTAVNQLDQVIQQNAAMVEQSTAATHALSRETDELAGLVSRFGAHPDQAAPAKAFRAAPRAAVSRTHGAAALKAVAARRPKAGKSSELEQHRLERPPRRRLVLP